MSLSGARFRPPTTLLLVLLMNRAQEYEFNLWDEEYSGVPQSYPFVYGPDGQGEIHAPAGQPGEQASQPSIVEPVVEGSTPTAGEPRPSAIDESQSQSVKPGVVSYAIPTPNTPLPQSEVSSSASETAPSSIVVSSSPSPSPSPSYNTQAQTSGPPAVVTRTLVSVQTPSNPTFTSPASPGTSLQATSLAPLASSVSITPTTSVLYATPTPPPPAPSTPVQAFRHTPGFIVLIILCLLVFLGTLFASLSWLVGRKRRKDGREDENWIGELVYDEPSEFKGGSGTTEHNNVGRRDTAELEKGDDSEENDRRHFGLGDMGEDSGRAGVGAGRWSSHNVPVEPGRAYATTPRQFTNTGYGFPPTPALNVHTPGLTPTPDYRRPSVLQRGPPPVDHDSSYGLDGGGLTFRRDPAAGGGTYLAPVTEHADIITPNPYSRSPTSSPHTRLPGPAHDSVSHYSYALDRAGPFAVTNLLPGDISSSASLASLNGAAGGVRSLGLPTGRLDDPNPWKRYEGVENRGGSAGVDSSATETGEGGWVGTIRSGLYTAVGKIVGSGNKNPEVEEDKFTSIPEPARRSTQSSNSRPSGRQSRILQRLNSTASSAVTTYSSEDGQVFSTRATSRRDTISTWTTTRSRSARGGKKEDRDEGGGEGGVSEMKARVASTASSEWGSGDLVRVLGLEGGYGRKERET